MAKYQGTPEFSHAQPPSTGVLLVNLGTPDAPTPKAVRRYLKEFLWDPRVVEMARPAWWLLLNLVILPFRPRRSAEAYRKIWTERGSPLLFHGQDLRDRVAERLGDEVVVELAMRYGRPSLAEGLDPFRITEPCGRIAGQGKYGNRNGIGRSSPASSTTMAMTNSWLIMLPNSRTASATVRVISLIRWNGRSRGLGVR